MISNEKSFDRKVLDIIVDYNFGVAHVSSSELFENFKFKY